MHKMNKSDSSDQSIAFAPAYLALRPSTIEKVFTDCVIDLREILVLDGIDILPDGFRIRCHDLHGQLPMISMINSGDPFRDKDRLGNEVCKLIAIVILRNEMIRCLLGSEFMLPTTLDGKAVVGLQAEPLIWLTEGETFLSAYHDLRRQVVG
jgi:hypothetical protein